MYWFLPLMRGHPSWKDTFLVQKGWSHRRGFTVYINIYKLSVDVSVRGASLTGASACRRQYSLMSHTLTIPSTSAVTSQWLSLSVAIMMLPTENNNKGWTWIKKHFDQCDLKLHPAIKWIQSGHHSLGFIQKLASD